ncbi:MAG: replicative DNA helicase [Epulopiscium sp. Nele67-Bin002]|nr:MAG: replicative DNA helicase [Epulopiscium sp. Nuni2H_MBin001]OON91123.1 MAG: replicative DNA helicase [Epulopiscium sp. Nele67-Bin002]
MVPPHNVEAEQSVLGSIIMDSESIIIASEILRPSDFYRPNHQEIYNSILDLHFRNQPVDLVTIQNRLQERGVLEQIGGISYLAELGTIVPTSAHIKHYAKIVEDKSNLRKLIKASQEISAKSYEGEETVSDIMGFAEKEIFNILQNKHTEDFSPLNQIIVTSLSKIEAANSNKGGITGVPTGFTDLDYKTAGLQPSDLILVAARPSMGKTAFALNIIQSAAVKHKKKVAVFSLEMAKDQLVNRMLCAEAMVDAQKVRTGNLDAKDWDSIARAMPRLTAADIFIDDTPGISIMEMRAKCRRLKMDKGLDLIMIDYLQLMSGSSTKSESRQQEISEISRSLKALAREMNAPVVALSQLSRACEGRADHRPMLSDLRESGAIEQDADVVMFLYRDEYYNVHTDKKSVGEVIIAKQRNGPTGTVELTWLGKYTKFADSDKSPIKI